MDIDIFPTELGWFAILGENGVLRRVHMGFGEERAIWQALERDGIACDRPRPWQPRLAAQLNAFAAGKPQDFADVPLDLSSYSPFGSAVIDACRAIEWGQTRTYGQLACQCGAPKAARAVGNIMAANRFPLIVPCHRVVAAGGRLGGFSAPQGTDLKRRLLALENPPANGPGHNRATASAPSPGTTSCPR